MSINLISKLYIGYFGRAGDPEGLDYWLQQMSSENESPMSLADIAQSFSVQPESTEQYPFLADPSADPEPFLLSVYKNLFNRDSIDTEGLNYWKEQIASGRPIGLIIIDIISGAQGADAVMVENKADVAAYYTEQYKVKGAEWDAGDLVAAKAVLDGVTDDAATVESGKSAVDTAITEDMQPANQAPVASGPVELEAILEDADAILITTEQLLANVTDADGDTPSIASVALADEAAGELIPNEDGTWSFKPASNFNGTVSFTVTVTDGKESIETSATLEVTPVNDFPVAGEPIALETSPEDVPVILTSAQLLANASDVDRDELTVTEVSVDEAFGTVAANEDGTWTFTPAKDLNGTVEFTYTVSDGQDQDQGSATLELTPVNDAPVITGAETTRIGEEMFEISGFAPFVSESLAVTETAVITDAEGNFAGGSIRIDVSGKIGDHTLEDGVIPTDEMGIFPALKEGDEVVGKFYAVGSNLVMRAGVVGNAVDTVIGTYKAGFVDSQVEGEGFGSHDAGEATFATVTLNGNATSEIVTELLKNIRLGTVDSEEGDLNVKVTVTDGNSESDSFTRLLDVEGAAQMTKDDESPYESNEEVELSERINHKLGSEEIDFDSNGSVMDGATITVTGSNWVDTLRLVATDASIEEGQARFILNVDGTYDVSVKIDINDNDQPQEIVIGTTAALPKAGDQLVITLNENASDDTVEALLNSLTVDMSDDLGERTFTVVYESAKGPNELVSTDTVEINMTRTVVGDFKEVTMAQLIGATALSPITIDSNTRIILSGEQALDIEQAIEDDKIIVSGENHLIRLISASDSDISGVTGLDLLGTYSFHDIDGNLTITAEQADGRKADVTTGHTLTVTGIENLLGLDLSKLDAGEGSIVAELNAATDVTFSGDLGNASMTVTGSGDLTVSADLATGKTIAFANGTIVITGFGTSPYNLSQVTAGQVTTAVSSDLEINKDAQLGTLELEVAQNVTLTLTATQADERTILGGDVDGNGNKGASIIVTDLVDDIDLSNIEDSDILVGAVNATQSDLIVKVTGLEATADKGVVEANGLTLGDFVVQIDEGATLKTDGGSISGESIQGAGSIIVLATGSTIDVDLSKVTVTGSKTLEVAADGTTQPQLAGGAKIGDFDVKVDHGATFTLTAAQANGKTITGADAVAEDPDTQETEARDAGSITVNLDGASAYDLTGIKAGAASTENGSDAGKLVAIVTDDVILDADAKLGDFEIEMWDGIDGDASASLTLSADQADERVVSLNSGTLTGSVTVTVTGLAADTDLSGIAEAADVTAEVGTDLDVSANTNLLGYVDTYKVLDGKVLTLSALQADGVSISGTADNDDATLPGTVVIAGDIVADTDGSGSIDAGEQPIVVNLEDVGLGLSFDDGSIDVGVGVTLELTAAQANGKVITGAGNVTVTGLGSTAVDLSQITVAGTKTAEVSGTQTLNSATKLGTFGLELVEDARLTLSASQATSIDKIVGDEDSAVIINGTAIADNLDFSGKEEWSFDSLTINGSGGNDYLKAPAGVDTITFNGGLGSDNFDVASDQTVTVQDFSLTADELNIDANGTARITVSGTADLSAVEEADRLENNGRLEITGSVNADTITGTSGDDVFMGGLGNDTFVFKPSSGNDTIQDFELGGLEKIDLTAFTSIDDISDLSVTNDWMIGNRTTITHTDGLGTDLQITLVGVSDEFGAPLTNANFKFYVDPTV
ncbi:cadherin-like domain-containing protein [Skermanella rosea]|uniref:cadherin-like domain-containing protein n=1 Tax=Skermanella rosea TaxID=1817965 RepID=UPI00193136DC|nr:cadherin-like domain-containing protein [Skermanella rosea]UEM03210.1 cadherin-like domain-containing protein [Skermanella rosea]